MKLIGCIRLVFAEAKKSKFSFCYAQEFVLILGYLFFFYLSYFFGFYKGLSFTWVVVFVPGQDGDFPSVCLPQVQQHHHKTGMVQGVH